MVIVGVVTFTLVVIVVVVAVVVVNESDLKAADGVCVDVTVFVFIGIVVVVVDDEESFVEYSTVGSVGDDIVVVVSVSDTFRIDNNDSVDIIVLAFDDSNVESNVVVIATGIHIGVVFLCSCQLRHCHF